MSWTSPLTVAITSLLRLAAPVFLLLDVRHQMGDGLLHHPGGFHHLGKKHLTGSEEVAHDVHAVHQRTFDDIQRPLRGLPSRLGIVDDEAVDAMHERMFEALGDGPAAPILGRRFFPPRTGGANSSGRVHQPFGRILAPVEDHVLGGLPQVRGNVLVHRQFARD